MTCSLISRPAVICDWLDVTFAPDDCPYPELNRLLMSLPFSVSSDGRSVRSYSPIGGRGKLVVTHAARFAKVSISGGVCDALRELGVFEELLHVLSSSPHRVTRVDAALDVFVDAPDILSGLCARYPSGLVSLSRKALASKRIFSTRADGRESGTFYVGHRTNARFTARVYDKALEALERRGQVLPPTTRFEVTARKDSGATLRDAARPESLFWHIASPALLQLPEGVPVWQPNTEMTWNSPAVVPDAVEAVRRRVAFSAELEAFADLGDDIGPHGRDFVALQICEKLGIDLKDLARRQYPVEAA